MGTTELKKIEIMDCTLRDGEQTSGVSFLPHEKLMMARMLLGDVNVDRIEVASARVSEGEKDAVRMICRYAQSVGKLDRVEVRFLIYQILGCYYIVHTNFSFITLTISSGSGTMPPSRP